MTPAQRPHDAANWRIGLALLAGFAAYLLAALIVAVVVLFGWWLLLMIGGLM